jgi:hypothetical protein
MAQGRSFEQCSAAVEAAGKIGKKAALELLSEVYSRAEAMQATGRADPYMMAVSDLADAKLAEAQRAKLYALHNAAARTQWRGRAEAEAEGRIAPTVGARLNPLRQRLTLADGLASVLSPIQAAKRLDTVEGLWNFLSRQFVSPMGNKLRQLGISKAALSGAIDSGTREALWRLNGGTPDPRITISKEEQAFAEALHAPLELLKERLNDYGAHIGDAVDYVTHTSWDSRQLRAAAGKGAEREAAYQKWKADDVPRMGEKTFDDILPREGETAEEAKERFIRSIYDATESGMHLGSRSMAGLDAVGDYIPAAYEGTQNLARQASHQRVVYWKNAEAWGQHMEQYGGGRTLYENVMRTLDGGARRIALMEYLGINVEGNFETIVQRMLEENRTSDELGRLQRQIEGVRNQLGRLTGRLNRPISEDAGQLTNQLMSFEAVTHLGGVSWTHAMAAPATITSEMVHHGVGRIQTIAYMLASVGRGTAERQEVLADAGAYAHGYANAVQRAGTPRDAWRRDGFPGFVSWVSAHFMNTTGLPRLLDAFQANAVKGVLMARLGRAIDQEFAEIEPHQQAALSAYGITPEEWSLLRSSTDPSMVEGNRWLTPSDAVNSDPAATEALLRSRGQLGANAAQATIDSAVRKFQYELGDKLGMYLNDAADHAVVRPGSREQGIVLGAAQPGTAEYFMRRAVGQFKMWPLAATTQILGRDIARSLSTKEMLSNIGIMVALSTVGGALRMAVNDAAVGRPQQDYTKPLTLLAAFAQGGGLGIYSDFLFGETNRMGGGIVSTVAGPLVGEADRFINIFSRFKADLREDPGKAMQHMWPDLVHWGLVQHIPFANLIYLKGTLDYLLWYHIFEASSPGWWERVNRRLQKEQGRTMVGYRPGGGIPYTPFGIGAR